MATKRKTALTRRTRDAVLAQWEQLGDSRAGQMLIEDIAAMEIHGADTARVAIGEKGEVILYCADEHIADKVEPAVQHARRVRTRVLPRVTREMLAQLPVVDEDDD